jgi:glutamate racemase
MLKIENHDAPIGVFDSGLGGLTVVKALMKRLPHEDIVYFGDTARVPYGTKSKEAIIRFSQENTEILLKHQVKMVVVACNSSSSYALPTLKKVFDLPIIGVIRPGSKKAVELSKNKKVGVIATSATIKSQEYARTIKEFDRRTEVLNQACPLFVPLVEEGWLSRDVTEEVAKIYLSSLKKAQIDTLILGCTHYPLLKDIIKKVMGPKVQLIDSASEVALEVERLLTKMNLRNKKKTKAKYSFLISDRPQEFKKIAKKFMGYELLGVRHV